MQYKILVIFLTVSVNTLQSLPSSSTSYCSSWLNILSAILPILKTGQMWLPAAASPEVNSAQLILDITSLSSKQSQTKGNCYKYATCFKLKMF